ncbi:MAG: hypothetical protein NVS3B24_14590 [Candidatus Dormibacteria bacterium]
MTEVITAPIGGAETGRAGLPKQLLDFDSWSDVMVEKAGIKIVDAPFLSIGGGLGSFAMVDRLRIAGLAPEMIKVVSVLERPYETYKYLAEISQITDEDRLRSPACAMPDNIWAFPTYAWREARQEKSLRPLWNVLTEPVLTEFFDPKAKYVYQGVDREAARIGWREMLVPGEARAVRRRDGGGFFSVTTPFDVSDHGGTVAFRSQFLHIAVGYPSLRFLPDLQAYRQTYFDEDRVVNSYERHDHVYEDLLRRPGTVVIRGAGIVASRILQRLLDDRELHGAQTRVVHLFRHYLEGATGKRTFRRPVRGGVSQQPFTFPKGATGGELKNQLARLEGKERADFIRSMSGTTTPHHKYWEKQLARGIKGGWYEEHIGEVKDVRPGPADKVITRVSSRDGSIREIAADYIIDCTGLEGEVDDHVILADLLRFGGAGKNPYGRLDVEKSFEVRGTRSEQGRIYASGSITLGGPYAPVDSFAGLQYASMQILDDLAGQGFCKRIGPLRSTIQWLRYMRNQPV